MEGISAVIATLNRKDELERLLKSIISNSVINIELIIVDQNSDSLIDDIVATYSNSIVITHLKMTEHNQSKARNYGASFARYNVVCFPDDDCWFESNSLNDIQVTFKNKPSIDLLVIHWKENPVQNVKSGYLSTNFIYSFKAVGYATYVLFFSKEKFMKLGGFLESIGIGKYIGGGEDSEITFRAANNNYKIYYDASIPVHHKYIPVYSRDLPVIRARQRAMGLLYYKYPVSWYVIFRGIISPLMRMITAGKSNEIRKHYNVFIGRMQGFIHGIKKGKQIFIK